MTTQPDVLTPVLAAWGFGPDVVARPLAGGLINKTYLVTQGARTGVLQSVNAIFGPKVHLDIEAITAHLEAHGMLTPRLVKTTGGELWWTAPDATVWRMLTFLEGRTVEKVPAAPVAHAAGALVARFHQTVSSLKHTFHFSRPGAHDTPLHMQRLERALAQHAAHTNFAAVQPIGLGILEDWARLERLPALPTRLIHGDLKISNLLLDDTLTEGRALLDLDTMAHLTIPVELGDAFRSWCNPDGEDAAGTFRADLYQAAVTGYAAAAPGFLTPEEVGCLVLGAQTIALELAARFCADALQEAYFGWNSSRFPSRSEHNRVRASGQLNVSRAVRDQRSALEAVTAQAFQKG